MPLKAAELEVLYTANTVGLDKGERKAKESAERIESRPVVQKVGADVSDALAGMDRVEAAVSDFDAALAEAGRTSSGMASGMVRDFLESDRAAKKTAEQIESVLTRSYGVSADAARQLALITKGELRGIAAAASKADTTVSVEADTSEALAGMDRVETAARKLVSERAVLVIDGDITRTDKALERARAKLEDLSIRAAGGFEVAADVKRAESNLTRLEQQAERLAGLRASVEVDASTAKAEAEIEQLGDKVADATGAAGANGGASFVRSLDGATRGAGQRVGDAVGSGVEDSLISALTAIPVAGGIILAGVAIGKAITGAVQDGLQQEVGFDRLEALTGINPASAMRIGRAAGEAYANVFGDSIESNMDTARLALQFDFLDGDSTAAEARKTVEGLAGIADVLGEDVAPVARAVATLLKTGLASNAREAFDIIAAGEREGVNRGEDLLDTLTEYSALFARLGLTGPQSVGLVSQALAGGARNGDLAADALKEFQIRATDASEASAEGFKALGLDAEEMTAKIARGGEGARDGLGLVLDRLRDMEDPVKRNAAAVALFGTQAEDLGDALFRMDLSKATDEIGQVEGAWQRMSDTLSNNDATRIEQAGRNIEVTMDGIKGALAAGFSEPIGEAAEWVSQNRGPVLRFFLDLANAALDSGEGFVEAAAAGTESFGQFVSGPLADAAEGVAVLLRWLQQYEQADGIQKMVDDMRGFDDQTGVAADNMRTNLGNALDTARGKLNEFAEPAVALGFLNDASLRLADALSVVGVGGDGARFSLEQVNLENIRATESGRLLEGQIRGAVGAMQDELDAAAAAGEGQDLLRGRYEATTGALVGQLEQMGFTREGAQQLIERYGAVPGIVDTTFQAHTEAANQTAQEFLDKWSNKTITFQMLGNLRIGGGELPKVPNYVEQARGGILQPMALGGIPDLTPMSPTAAVVPPGTWRVVGDRMDVPEAFVPMDGSPRSLEIQRTLNRMQPEGAGGGGVRVDIGGITVAGSVDAETISMIQRAVEVAVRDAMPSGMY